MKYDDIKEDMLVTDGKISGLVTHKLPIGQHKPIIVKAVIGTKSMTLNFWPGDLKEVLNHP